MAEPDLPPKAHSIHIVFSEQVMSVTIVVLVALIVVFFGIVLQHAFLVYFSDRVRIERITLSLKDLPKQLNGTKIVQVKRSMRPNS